MKKSYEKPSLELVEVQAKMNLCNSSDTPPESSGDASDFASDF